MTPLNWQEKQQNSNSSQSPTIQLPANFAGFMTGIMGGAAVSLLLVGLAVGYVAARWANPSVSAGIVAQAPSAPSPAAPAPQPPAPSAPLPPIDAKTDHIRGNFSKAKVAVVEYSDFECPFCKRHHPTMKQVMDTYKNDVVWVYRHFPLGFHPNAQKEAEASECANELGGNDAFWKYTDAIFERTTAGGTGFPLENLSPLAKELGLNEAKFKTCLDGGKFAGHVKDDMDKGSQAGVSGTPGNFVVNLKTQTNQEISGAVPFSSFQTAIDALLKP